MAAASLIAIQFAIGQSGGSVFAQQVKAPTEDKPMSAPQSARQSQAAHASADHNNDRKPNRLIHETSPYLLQHAYNPVDWYPWGEEAFRAAREQDKPIFLSVGYSTCYWCHVMERESFEDPEIAALMNEHFICIKVDREERPDVDDIYMTAVQILTGSGGWPMSVFLEPHSLQPFMAGTYFPPRNKFGRPGFPFVLQQMSNAWTTQREAVLEQAQRVAQAVIEQHPLAAQPQPLGSRIVDEAVAQLLASYDAQNGGFVGAAQRAPKFPMPVYLEFLIGAAWDSARPRAAVMHTLDRMAIGGMYDQIGGGFHRYSVDEKWLVPHFEKMLYDNGQLASLYARAYELTKDDYYAEIVRETLDYVLREMTDDSGAFYSAQDAEVNAREGGNYVWVEQEVRDALAAASLGDDDIALALEVYGFTQGTNFQDPHHPEDGPKNVVHLIDKPDALARRLGMSLDEFNGRINRINAALLAARNKRQQPGIDDKILASWNGLMIAGFADGGRVLREPRYIEAAERAVRFILEHMRASDGGLLRSSRNGEAKIDAFLEDYAMVIRGLLALHRATGDRRMLEHARNLADIARKRFWDESAGGYFDTLEGQTDLFVRIKSVNDGSVPSGNGVMLHNLLDLHEATNRAAYLDDAVAALRAFSSTIEKHPTGAALSTLALKRIVDRYPQKLEFEDAASMAAGRAAPGLGGLGGYGARVEPVTIAVEPEEVEVKPGVPAQFNVVLRMAEGYHINAHQPGADYLVPLKIELTGCEGLSAKVEYPAGERYTAEYADGTINVHHGTLMVPVRIEQIGVFSGRPQLVITYQVCTDRECLQPKRELVGVRIFAER